MWCINPVFNRSRAYPPRVHHRHSVEGWDIVNLPFKFIKLRGILSIEYLTVDDDMHRAPTDRVIHPINPSYKSHTGTRRP